MILAIDVSAQLGLLSLELPDGECFVRFSDRPREHLEFLGRALAELRDEAGRDWSELERVGVTLGPGSFTGLRVGLATAKGLVFGREIPLAPLPSLSVPRVAADPELAGALVVTRRARGQEYWLGDFAAGDWRPSSERLVAAPDMDGAKVLGDLPDAEPEPGPVEQLQALARLTRESDVLVSGPELDRLLPRYLLAPSVTAPGRSAT